ncbi:MAG: tyrosine-type recombinase/integrase [Bacteroidota bacterium]
MQNILGKLSIEDVEKLKILFSMIPNTEQKEVVTLRVFIDEYKNLIQHNRSASYLKSVRIAFEYLVDFFTQKDNRPGLQKSITSIEPKDIENFLIYLQQKVKRGYVVYYRNLKAAFNKAKDWGYVKENYFTKVKLPKRQKTAPAFLNCNELIAISCKIDNPLIKEIVITAFFTGMRLSEILNLTWRNVNMTTRIITVGDEHFATKSRNQRFIPISDEVDEIFTRKIEKKNRVFKLNEDYVFCKTDGTRFCTDYVSKSFKKACNNAGIDKSIHFHSLRHSFASNLAQKGISLYIIKELLGHSSITTTEIYSHLNMDSLKDAIKTFDGPHSRNEFGTSSKSLSLKKGEGLLNI